LFPSASIARVWIELLGSPELPVLYTIQLTPSNFAKPPPEVPIQVFPWASLTRALMLLFGSPELLVLYTVQLTPSNFAKPPP
jgi:hypothetical protein